MTANVVPETKGFTVKLNARSVLITEAFVALAVPAAATATVVPIKHPSTVVAKHVTKKHVAPLVLCICFPHMAVTPTPFDESFLEAAYDQDLIAHGLDPVYGPTTTGQATAG
jgi:hypothetical protein